MKIVFGEDSGIELEMDGGGFSIRRASKGSDPFLDIVADVLCEDDDIFGDETDKVREFLRQSGDMEIVVGEERCG